jgi:hypothetical protein
LRADWNKRQTLDSLIKKAGYDGVVDDALLSSIAVERYQGEKVDVRFDDWPRKDVVVVATNK